MQEVILFLFLQSMDVYTNGHPERAFFPKVPNFWAWADKLGKKCRGILCKPQCPSWHLILYWLYIIWKIAFTCPSLVEIKSNLMSLKPWEQHNCPRDILKFHILSLSPTKIFTWWYFALHLGHSARLKQCILYWFTFDEIPSPGTTLSNTMSNKTDQV